MTEQPPHETSAPGETPSLASEEASRGVEGARVETDAQTDTGSVENGSTGQEVGLTGAEDSEHESEPTPEELAAQEEAQHAHFLSTYEPVLTRLPDALGTAPEHEYVASLAPKAHDGEEEATTDA